MVWPTFKNLRDIDRVADDEVERRARVVLKELECALKHVDELEVLIPEDEHARPEDTTTAISAAYVCIATIVPKLQRARGNPVADITETAPDAIEHD
jgi:hypothetical protein